MYQYYSNLYRRHYISLEKIDEYFRKQNLPNMTEERQIMNGPITTRDVSRAIKKRKPGFKCLD